MSQAKTKFDKTINRCNEMVFLYQRLKERDPDGNISQDILRGAIVLSVAAFDAYATDVFSEHFVQYIKKYGVDESLEGLLQKAGFNIKFALELVDSERPYRKIRTLIDHYYTTYTTQKLEVIDELFKQYHIKKLTLNAAKRSGKSEKNLLISVQKIIQRRHGIVHDGDYNEHNKIREVTSADIKRIEDIKTLVENMDAIINNRMNPPK